MDKTELRILAKKYLDGTATAEEKELLGQWYKTINEDDHIEVVTADETEHEIKHRILYNLHTAIAQDKSDNTDTGNRGARMRQMYIRVASAAAALLLFAGAAIYYTQNNKAAKPADSQFVSITAPKVMKIVLADGSTVWLNAHSVFKYPKSFTAKVRQVELVEGRAFFDVVHQAQHPFLVKTKTLNITVLGTSFDVRTYANEGTTRVSVITGKVGVTRPGHANEPAVMLLPKQQVILSKVNSLLTKEVTKEPVVNLWCKSPLVFDQENLDNVFKAIEKQYNTHIEVSDKALLDEHVSITLGNQRLDTIMEILSFTKHFKYKIANDSTVMIK
jgi:transmembrane sensor